MKARFSWWELVTNKAARVCRTELIEVLEDHAEKTDNETTQRDLARLRRETCAPHPRPRLRSR